MYAILVFNLLPSCCSNIGDCFQAGALVAMVVWTRFPKLNRYSGTFAGVNGLYLKSLHFFG